MNNIFELSSKYVLITGATGYLGKAMAYGLCEAGATVLVNGRSTEKVRCLVSALKEEGFKAEEAIFDISSEEEVRGFFVKIKDRPLDGIINNAYSGVSGSIESATNDRYRNSYEIAMVASHFLLNEALPLLRKAVTLNGSASVINIASMYGMVSPDQRIYEGKANANPPFYGAAKAALIQWSKYAACEFGWEGIRVNAISPGPFPASSVQEDNPSFISILADKVPLRRIGLSKELKGPVVFLISDASSYVNGINLVVDGGWTCW